MKVYNVHLFIVREACIYIYIFTVSEGSNLQICKSFLQIFFLLRHAILTNALQMPTIFKGADDRCRLDLNHVLALIERFLLACVHYKYPPHSTVKAGSGTTTGELNCIYYLTTWSTY